MKLFIEMPSLNRHEKVTGFMEFSVNIKKLENLPYKFFVIISFALLRSSYFNFSRPFQILQILTNFIQVPFLYRHGKGTSFMVFIVNGKENLRMFPLGLSSLF